MSSIGGIECRPTFRKHNSYEAGPSISDKRATGHNDSPMLATHSALVSSSICCRAKLTGCAPGKLVWCRPKSSATSERMVLKRSPDAFTPGSESEVICDIVQAPVADKPIRGGAID
jgi:hypothetical protein